ncbi:MAG TPA: hypothetical protein VGS19_07415 [Streptosporangiaceae bacterium]|nr:hypothetical protein [Streptosporangiaceae bacterium]
MRSILSRVSGTRRPRSIRGVALTAGLAIAAVPTLVFVSSAQAGTNRPAPLPVHQAHVTHQQSADSGPAVHHDTSLPLRVLAARAHPGPVPRRVSPDRGFRLPHPPASHRADPVVQTRPGTRRAVATTNNFDGISDTSPGNSCGCTPPDPNAAVGTTQVVEVVNTAFAVYSKTGSTIMAPTATNTLWSGFGGMCQSTNDGDATVAFDRLADRWVIQQFANVSSASGPYFECVAVSTSADATGTYNRYSFQFSTFPDYPKLSVWPDAYYTTYNMFTPAGSFIDAEICAMNRANMLTGAAATQQCFTTDANHGGILAADLDGSTPPPSGEPETVMGIGTTSTTLDYWHFHVDFTTPANSTFTGPTDLSVASYSTACGGGTCIPQSGTSQQLDSLGDRIMYRLAYRNFGDHESLVTDQSVTAGSSTGVRWYEFRLSGGNPAVFQQGTYAPDSTFRWMGSIAMDHAGNIALGYSQSSASTHPSIRFTGRAPGDPLGTMTQAETTVFTGSGSETGASRWGDYTSMSIDPSDDCTFWYTNEYQSSDWNTRLASFQLPGCTSGGGSDFTISASPNSGSVNPGGSATSTISVNETGTSQTVNLSASGLPSGATAGFSPASLNATGTSAMTISTASSTAAGTYPITVTGTGTVTHSTTYTLTVNSTGGGGIVNGGFETGNLSGWTASGAATGVTTSGPHSGTFAAMLGLATPTNGDSSVAQTFTVPSGMGTLSFWYNVTCPDSVTFDWATATLKDNTANTTTTPLAKTCVSNSGWTQVTAPVTAGHSYTLTLTSHDDNFNNPPDPTFTKYDDVTLSAAAANPIVNGGFETGSFSGWTTSGASTSIVSSGQHSGSFAARAGNTTPTNGNSNIAQTFTAASGNTTLSFWYNVTCPDSVTFDWATATLKDNTANTTTTVLAKTCVSNSGWTQVTAHITAGHSYTLTLTSHDDNFNNPPDPTFTLFDDVSAS